MSANIPDALEFAFVFTFAVLGIMGGLSLVMSWFDRRAIRRIERVNAAKDPCVCRAVRSLQQAGQIKKL